MRPTTNLLVLGGWFLLGLSTTLAVSEYQYLEVTKRFLDAYLAPNNVKEVASVNRQALSHAPSLYEGGVLKLTRSFSTIFAEDVRGTVDATTNFDGRELSTDYIFGLFVNTAADPNQPSIIGIPQAYTIAKLLVQHNTVSVGSIFDWWYPALNQSFPIEIEAFLTFNDQSQISQYDIIIRRWAWAMDTIIPLLTPSMAEYLGISASNSTLVLQQYLAASICTGAMASCNGSNAQYDSYDDCVAFVTSIPIGQVYRAGENNLLCRALQTPLLPLRPSVHCPQVGQSGGNMCIDREYIQVVGDNHFPSGFIGPIKVTPENQELVAGLKITSAAPFDSLLAVVLNGEYLYSWDPTLYATCTFVYFLILYAFASALHFVYIRYVPSYRAMPRELQRNVVQYILNIVFTTIALALQLCPTPGFADHYRVWEIQCMRMAAVLVSGLYIFELIYRHSMRWPLIIHHILTIFAISFSVAAFEYLQSVKYMMSAVIWLFQATTEQPTFVGLIGYRLKWSRTFVSRTLKIAAWQTFVFKCASAIGLLVYWGLNEDATARPFDLAWTVFLWLIAGGLLATQAYGSWCTYLIGVRYASRALPEPELPEPEETTKEDSMMTSMVNSPDLMGEQLA